MNIGIDIDNVISNFDEALLEEYLKHDNDLKGTGIVNKDLHMTEGMFDWTEKEEREFYLANIERIVKTRVSQGSFRRLLLLERHHCNLCNISTTSVLRASHIKEWSESSREERIDANNGLLLCANHDALFDRHLISFNPDTGNICISESIDNEQRKALSISESTQLSMGERMKSYMRIHYKKFIDKENQ